MAKTLKEMEEVKGKIMLYLKFVVNENERKTELFLTWFRDYLGLNSSMIQYAMLLHPERKESKIYHFCLENKLLMRA